MPTEGDATLRDFRFRSGEALAELRVHYRTYGASRRDASGVVRNAVLITHGTTGSGAQFMGPAFAGQLFGAGQPLDAAKYFIVFPTASATGSPASPVTVSTPGSPATATWTWWMPSGAC
ncbi:MAG TPA: hypothetical protein VGJ89_00440 [Geothrix sp.]|jgi:homoserine O-acetyltransferase